MLTDTSVGKFFSLYFCAHVGSLIHHALSGADSVNDKDCAQKCFESSLRFLNKKCFLNKLRPNMEIKAALISQGNSDSLSRAM